MRCLSSIMHIWEKNSWVERLFPCLLCTSLEPQIASQGQRINDWSLVCGVRRTEVVTFLCRRRRRGIRKDKEKWPQVLWVWGFCFPGFLFVFIVFLEKLNVLMSQWFSVSYSTPVVTFHCHDLPLFLWLTPVNVELAFCTTLSSNRILAKSPS